jgi:hypothetical protein
MFVGTLLLSRGAVEGFWYDTTARDGTRILVSFVQNAHYGIFLLFPKQ